MVRKVELNVDRWIPPGLFYDLGVDAPAIEDIRTESDRILPAHDPEIAPV